MLQNVGIRKLNKCYFDDHGKTGGNFQHNDELNLYGKVYVYIAWSSEHIDMIKLCQLKTLYKSSS